VQASLSRYVFTKFLYLGIQNADAEQGNWFDPELTIDTVSEQGNTKVMDVNVMGTLNFSRIAAVFLREAQKKQKANRSLVLLSSVNAFRESPGLFLYQTSKHAIQGVLRSSRKTLWERDSIRVNVSRAFSQEQRFCMLMPPYRPYAQALRTLRWHILSPSSFEKPGSSSKSPRTWRG
jgi:hypothetical protein